MESTTLDDDTATAQGPEGVLSPPAVEPPAEPKRGRGRPPGARNKPKLPGAPPPAPGRRPRTTTRKAAPKALSTEQKIAAAWGLPVAGAAIAGQVLKSPAFQADAIVLEHYSAGAAKILAPLADSSPRFAALLDKLGSGSAGPAVAAAMFGLSLGAQLAVNHGLIPAAAVASFGAVPRDQVLDLAQREPAPEPARQEPAHAPVQDAADAAFVPVADPWAAGTVPPDWQ